MSTVHPKVEKPSREQLLAEQLKKEHVRLKDIDKMEQKEFRLSRRDWLAAQLARLSAIKPGKRLESDEMKNLVDRLFACSTPYMTASGKLTFITNTLEEMEKQFENKSGF